MQLESLQAGDDEPRQAKHVSASKLDPDADKLVTWLAIEPPNAKSAAQICGTSTQPSGPQKCGGAVFNGNLGSEVGLPQ